MKTRVDLMITVRKTVVSWETTQAKTAKHLGLTQPSLNDLLKGRITKISLVALINSATYAELNVKVRVRVAKETARQSLGRA
jgi:predicted XRE-type DNA-binding protein